jgi:hypothetical protein
VNQVDYYTIIDLEFLGAMRKLLEEYVVRYNKETGKKLDKGTVM